MPEAITYHYQLDGESIATTDPIFTGREIRSRGGRNPASDYVLIEIGENTSRSIGLEENIELTDSKTLTFLTFKGDRVFSLTVNERGYEWGADEISAADIRLHANIPEDHEIILDSDQDKVIEDDEVVYLKPSGVERILSRVPEKICVIINTRQKWVSPGRISFMELVTLAFPNLPIGPNTALTVSYRKGHSDAPEATLIEGESVKVKKGMVFNVSATDKS